MPALRHPSFGYPAFGSVQGLANFKAVPSHAIILCIIYPVFGLVLTRFA